MIPPQGALYMATHTGRPKRVHTRSHRRALIRDVALNPAHRGIPLDRAAAGLACVACVVVALFADRDPLAVTAALVALATAGYSLISRRRSIPRQGRQRDEAQAEHPPGPGLAPTASADRGVGGRWAHTET